MHRTSALLAIAVLVWSGPTRADEPPAYNLGEAWPLRNFQGVDFLEPLAPVGPAKDGDWGRVVLGTAIPYTALVGAFVLEPEDTKIQTEIERWTWLGLDKGQNNNPTLWALIAVSGLSLFLPAPEDGTAGRYEWWLRADRATVFALGMGVSTLETELLKKVFHRMRPVGSSDDSRPSGHATAAFAGAAFFSDVLRETLRPQDETRLGVRLLEETATALPYFAAAYIGLERVYAQRHFFSDVLLGAAIGAFTMHMFYEWSFLREEAGRGWVDGLSLAWDPSSQELGVQLAWSF